MQPPDPPRPRSLASVIEDMMISESKRYVELRLLRESLPADRRGPTSDALTRARATMERLSRFRASVLCRSYAGISLPEAVRARAETVARDNL